jgi:hypothetical protein
MVPVVTTPAQMRDGNDDEVFAILEIHDGEGELPEDVPSALRLDPRPRVGESSI